DVLNLVGIAGNDNFAVNLFATPGLPALPLLQGFPTPVQITDTNASATILGVTGTETVNLDGVGGAANTLTVTGVANQDAHFTYTPTNATSGIVTDAGFNNTFTFLNINGPILPVANAGFTIAGSPLAGGDDLGDQVIVNGTNNSDFILVDSPNRNVTVENAA